MRVLLVEDDHAIVRALTDLLEGEGFAVRSCATQDGAQHALAAEAFDIALLDVTLAQGNGFAVCAAAREAAPDMPVTMTKSGIWSSSIISSATQASFP